MPDLLRSLSLFNRPIRKNRHAPKPVYSPNESIHASTIFMVHLGCFPRLRQRICLINQKNDRATRRQRTF